MKDCKYIDDFFINFLNSRGRTSNKLGYTVHNRNKSLVKCLYVHAD